MKRRRIAAAFISAAVLAGMAAMIVPRMTMNSQPTEEVARVRLVQVALGEIEQVLPVTGHVRGVQEFAALSPENGVIRRLYVQAGDAVQAGMPLFRLDSSAQEQLLRQTLASGKDAVQLAEAAEQALPADFAAQQALQRSIDTQLTAAGEALRRCTVRAQADGIVAQVTASELSAVAAGTPVVMMQSEAEEVQCNVVARDAARVNVGMPARLSLCGRSLGVGSVTALSPSFVDQTTGQTVCQVTVTPETQLSLPLGASVDVEVVLYAQAQVPVLPVSAITDADTVWWAAEGRGYELPVTVVAQDEVHCWVNLDEGVTVVDGGTALVQGQRIREGRP